MRTLGSPLYALFMQATTGAASESSGTGIISLIARSTAVSLAVLLILGLLSIWSWGIFLYKWWTFRRAAKQSAQFLEVFRRSNKFSEVQAICRSVGDSPLVGLFQTGYAELTAQLRQTAPADAAHDPHPRAAAGRPTLKSLPAVDRALLRASAVEVNKLESNVSFLATVASMGPFIGLFGTVWGIMIAEALVATAAGLVAAIPAVLFYNYLSGRVKLFASEMDDFGMEFLNICERNFT